MIRIFAEAMFAVALSAVGATAASDTLRFTPPDSVAYGTTTVSAKVTDINGTVVRDSSVAVSQNKLKKTPWGYQLRYDPTDVVVFRDGQQQDNPIMNLMTGLDYTYVLDGDGMATAVIGFEDIHQKIDSVADSATAQMAKRVLTPESMSQQLMAEWNARMEMMINRPVVLNEITWDKTEYALPTQQTVPMYGGTVITDTLLVGGVPSVRVKIVYTSSPDTLATLLGVKRAEVVEKFQLSDSTLAQVAQQPARVISEVNLVAERESLLIREEQSRRDAWIEVTGHGMTQKMSSQETRHVTMTR